MRFSILVPGFLLGLITSTSSLALGQQTYRYVEIPLPATGIFASGLGVNNAGDVCGVAYLPANKKVGFLFERDTGVLNAFATLGTGAARREIGAHSVNDHREEVGIFAPSGLPKAFYWTPSEGLSDITYYPPVNNNILAEAHGIGNNGNITGANTFQCVASPTFGVDAGAIWNSHNDAPSASIDTPFTCGVGGMLVEINDHGSAVGTYVYSDGSSTWNRPLVVGPLGRHDLPTFNSLSECGAAENRANNTPRTGACY